MIFLLFQLSSAAAIIVETPSSRMYTIASEDRINAIDKDNRILTI